MKNLALYSNSMQAGKSTVADYLIELGYTKIKFARTLKLMLVPFLLNFVDDPWEYLEGSKKEHEVPGLGVTARFLMQTLGHDWGRMSIGRNDVWVLIETRNLTGDGYIVDDMRYENEYQKLRELGFTMIKLVGRGELTSAHGSEGNLDAYPFDYVIENAGTVGELLSKVTRIINEV
jgi:hypothetical protein